MNDPMTGDTNYWQQCEATAAPAIPAAMIEAAARAMLKCAGVNIANYATADPLAQVMWGHACEQSQAALEAANVGALVAALEGMVTANERARTASDNFNRLGGDYTDDDTETAEACAEFEDAHAALIIAENEARILIAKATGAAK